LFRARLVCGLSVEHDAARQAAVGKHGRHQKEGSDLITVDSAAGRPEGALRLAVQKDGRLTQDTLALLHGCGLEFDSYRNRLFAPCRNFPLSILYGRDDDIPGYVANGTVDAGIVGRNLLIERRVTDRVRELAPLGFAPCRLVIAVPKEAHITKPEDLRGQRIATTFPYIVGEYFERLRVSVEIVAIAGAVEMTPALGVAEAIADLAATGSSLLLHDLRPIATVLESEAVLVANPATLADERRSATLNRLLLRIRSVLAARRFKYVMMNAPRSALDDIRTIVPGLRTPTVVPLADPDWVAIHTVVEEAAFWEVIERLHAAGASEILVTPIEKLVMAQ
jgi:ATP phosphoribosyltransferase